MGVSVPPDPVVVKGGSQFGIFSLASLQCCYERSELNYCLEIRLSEGIRFVLAKTGSENITSFCFYFFDDHSLQTLFHTLYCICVM